MANINSPAVTTLASNVVRKNAYRGNVQAIPARIDNGTSLINSGDTITFTSTLPSGCKALGVRIFTAGVGNSSAITFSSGGTAISNAIVISGAIDDYYCFFEAAADSADVSGQTIIGTVSAGDWDDGANDVWFCFDIITDE